MNINNSVNQNFVRSWSPVLTCLDPGDLESVELVSQNHFNLIKESPVHQTQLMLGRVVRNFSRPTGGLPKQLELSQSTSLELSDLDIVRIRKDVLENYDALQNDKVECLFKKIGAGRHAKVYVHESYPNLVIKLGNQESIETRYLVNKKACRVVREEGLDLITVPRSTFIPIPEKVDYWKNPMAIFIQERAPNLLDSNRHQELWDLLIEEYQSTTNEIFKKNVLELTSQVSKFIGKVGYWDIQTGNGPIFIANGSKAFLIDFENIEPENPNEVNTKGGFTRLAELMVIKPLVEKIWEGEADCFNLRSSQGNYLLSPDQKEAGSFGKNFIDNEKRIKGFGARSEARTVYQERRWTFPTEDIPKIDYSRVPEGYRDFARKIELLLTNKLEEIKRYDDRDPLFQRYVHFQPGFSCDGFDGVNNKFDREKFEGTLEALKEQGSVVTWSFDDDKYSSSYTIYF